MFRGLTSIQMDTKGRFSIPTRYRASLLEQNPSTLVMTIDTIAPCLLLYLLSEWEVIEAKLQNLPSFIPSTRRIQRLLIGHATEVDIDSAGRVLIPPVLRNYAHLTQTVHLVGQGNKFEIWSDHLWEEHRAAWLETSSKESEDPMLVPEDLRQFSL